MWLLPGLAEQRIGLFVKMHHAIADGIAGVATVAAFLDATPDVPATPGPPWRPAPGPTAGELLADNLRRHVDGLGRALSTVARPVMVARQARAAWPAVRELFAADPMPAPSLNRMVGADRTFALVRGDLNLVKDIAHRHGATVNDVLLAITAGGLRGLLRGRGEPVDGVQVRTYVPVTLRPAEQRGQARGNLIGQMVVPFPVGTADPGLRLEQIAAETTTRKARSRPSLGAVFGNRIASRALLAVLNRRPVNVTTADLPGPQQPVYLAGARLLEVFPVLPLIANVSLGVGALSYGDQFSITVIADKDAYPDLDVFATTLRDDLRALAAAASPAGTP